MDHLYRTAVEPVLMGQQAVRASLPDVLRRIPKTDLHCHLNGSITPSLLAHMERLLFQERRRQRGQHLSDAQEVREGEEGHTLFFNAQEKRKRNVLASPAGSGAAAASPGASASHSCPKDRMNHCFSVFDAIYAIMTNLAFTRLAVQDMLLCGAAENIMVMEIRTSLRDGLRHTFRHHTNGAGEAVAAASPGGAATPTSTVSKEMCVNVVRETVEHLLCGGLVDLESGELHSMAVSAAILSAAAAAAAAKGTGGEDVAERWWRVYDRVYAPLFPLHDAVSPSDFAIASDIGGGAAAVVARRQWAASVLLPTISRRMHVRLLLSINRGAAMDAAWEAARLTTATQQHQIRNFHTWCATEPFPSAAAVLNKLRQTCWVTGMDLSGNCYKGDYTTFNAALAAARSGTADATAAIRATAAVTIHGGEKQDAAELAAMVDFSPERWGHLVFTDDANLSAILAAQQGIELCLTSNLLTSGHDNVAEHHLGHLLELWDTMAESRVTNAVVGGEEGSPGRCYNATQAARLESRLGFVARRWGVPPTPAAAEPMAEQSSPKGANGGRRGTYVLPNLSFHTDDRGVFGTTLSDELFLASQHPGVANMSAHLTGNGALPESTAGVARFFWQLERLSLLQIFELPLPVQLLATLLAQTNRTKEDEGTKSDTEQRRAAAVAAVSCAGGGSGVAWRDWGSFVQLCARASSATTTAGLSVPAALSAWEWAWLTDAFDHYYSYA